MTLMFSWRPNPGFCITYSSIQPPRYAASPLGLGLKSPSFDFDLKNFLCVFLKLSFKYKILGVRLRGTWAVCWRGREQGSDCPLTICWKSCPSILFLSYPCDNQWVYFYVPLSELIHISLIAPMSQNQL